VGKGASLFKVKVTGGPQRGEGKVMAEYEVTMLNIYSLAGRA
jgi:hypothetical protein